MLSEEDEKSSETQIDRHPKATLAQLDSIHILQSCKMGSERHLSFFEQNTPKNGKSVVRMV